MRPFLFVLFILLTHVSQAQVESEYYRNPADTTLYSKALGQNRRLTVILPTTFNPAKKTKYPLIIIFDRQNRAIFRQIFESVNYLNRFDQIPEAIIIGVTTTPGQRNDETSLLFQRKSAQGEQLIRFVFDELIPWSERTYNTGACRTLIGHSRFGYFTTAMMCRQAENLSGVISLSPFYTEGKANWVDSVTTRFSPTHPLTHKLFYRFVTGDSLIDTPDYARMKKALSQTRLQPAFDWAGYSFYKAKHNVVPGLGVMPSLMDIFSQWSLMGDSLSPFRPLSTRLPYTDFKDRTQSIYGQPISLGLARLNGLGSEYYGEKQYEMARLYWLEILSDYPFFTPVYVAIADSYLAQGRPKDAIEYLRKGVASLEANRFLSPQTQAELAKDIQQKLDSLR